MGVKVTARVQDVEGTPVAGMTVLAWPKGHKPKPEKATENADGSYTMDTPLQHGSHRFEVFSESSDYIHHTENVTIHHGAKEQTVVVTLYPAADMDALAFKGPADPAVDKQFKHHILRALREIPHEMREDGYSEDEILSVLDKVIAHWPMSDSGRPPGEEDDCCGGLGQSDDSAVPGDVSCMVCRIRYYTPGTPYYMNYAAYVQCVYGPPPCT